MDRQHQSENDFEIGPEANISDELFSIIIFLYVAVSFTYVFYAFCYNSRNIQTKLIVNHDHDHDEESLECSVSDK